MSAFYIFRVSVFYVRVFHVSVFHVSVSVSVSVCQCQCVSVFQTTRSKRQILFISFQVVKEPLFCAFGCTTFTGDVIVRDVTVYYHINLIAKFGTGSRSK